MYENDAYGHSLILPQVKTLVSLGKGTDEAELGRIHVGTHIS